MNAILRMSKGDSMDIEIQIHEPSLRPELKGRIVKPLVGLQHKEFSYVTALNTNLSHTFKRAFSQLGERVREKVAA